MEKQEFGLTKEGQQVTKYTLANRNGMEFSVIDLGATITSVKVQGRDGKLYDVVLGYDSPEEYQEHASYFGAVIGRNANRIHQARAVLDGIEYQLEKNENGNNLHSGSRAFHSVIWNVERVAEQSITFTYLSRNGEAGFPGNMKARVNYTLTDGNEIVITYDATSDRTTLANFTNHSYFNLDGHNSGSIENQEVQIFASYYTPVKDAKAIPTGEIRKVEETPMDFRKMKKIGTDIRADYSQLKHVGGYDHNYALDGADGTIRLAAKAKAASSGICMDVYTDCVGIQFYAGNFIGKQKGKDGAEYGSRHGFCLETQYFPNAINEEKFVAPVLKPGKTYHSVTKYGFGITD